MKKIQNSVPKVFTSSPIDVVVFKFLKNLSDGKSVKSCVIRVTKKILAASQTIAAARMLFSQAFSHTPTYH